ncbi:hypothetical protein [Bradyrhizobium ivorense]|uniref:hypothetical protein n=1 Tax=Bradyrhizobium ivorense TaxID=2511166 RepID=UPI0035589C77
MDPELHRDRSARGHSTEAVTDTILRRMPDYMHYICPQFNETDINFQRVPTADTSNPFTARWIPTPDESMLVIRFKIRAASIFCCRCYRKASCPAPRSSSLPTASTPRTG